MKTRINLFALLLLIGIGYGAKAQNYPADPSLAKIVADIKKDPKSKELMTTYGYNPADINKGKFRFAKKSELKDYFYVKWYGRSKHAWEISRNKNYMDERFFSVFLDTPKDANGVSHKIYFKVQYHRRTPQNFEDNKWNYDWLVLDTRENESYGLPKITDDERKNMMISYVKENMDTQYDMKRSDHWLRDVVQIDSILAMSHSVRYLKPIGAGKFYWTLTLRATYIHDSDSDGGIEVTRKNYMTMGFEAQYQNGKYNIIGLRTVGKPFDTYAPGWDAMYNSGLSKDQYYREDPVWMETIPTVGIEKLMRPNPILKEQPKDSEAYVEKRLSKFEEALKTMDTGDLDKIRAALTPIMQPSKAKELTDSYVDLIADFKRKLCTLETAQTNSRVKDGYSDELKPYINLTMYLTRKSATTKELKKKYKNAGMSSKVLKSTGSNQRYGELANTSYRPKLELKFVEGDWYITEPADPESTKVRF